MIVNMQNNATPDEINHIIDRIKECGFQAHVVQGAERTIIGAIGSNGRRSEIEALRAAPGVAEVIQISHPFKLVSRQLRQARTVVDVRGTKIGGGDIVVIAGPCSVESEEQLMETAHSVKASGANMLRGGAYKPRTSPYDFQGLGVEALRFLQQASRETGLPIVTEVMSEADVEIVEEYADVMQVGARNMQNFSLLKHAGRLRKPVLLKRGMSATLDEFLMAAEYIMSEGNYEVILCERGVRTFADHTRNTLDLSIVPAVQKLSHLPILVDPSHGTGKRDKVLPMARAAVAAGADGVLVEVHHQPEKALSDGPQSIYPEQFAQMVSEIEQIAPIVNRKLHRGIRVETAAK